MRWQFAHRALRVILGSSMNCARTVVDLTKLNRTEALACADPILTIDRSAEDIEGYRLTLREAIESPAVREIMTTPLQSHIMAVVVRDGGRPPERKWQLFHNFYQVIKKREANRNLADPRIAGLLREGDKLIKLLHNRLGFELHYRAERSSGAQTSITRAELKEIVSDIVHNLQDDDIENTIALLDEATTERLVLVNTPESGETVRFDIRPLQEFFAAEYIYESANQEGFIERLRSIAPDSHWREVLHFLLSALIEQERRGELAQAVEVLSEIDDSPLDQRRALARRLGVGGIISARLLLEGVVESDKRTREHFRKCLPPLLSSTDARSHVVSPPPQHTSAWLANVAVDTIEEKKPFENVGAACVLPLVLKDDSPLIEKIDDTLAHCDKGYLSVFLESLPQMQVRSVKSRSERSIPKWVIVSLLRRVLADDWSDLGHEVLSKIYRVLSRDHARLIDAAEACGVSSRLAKKIPVFFDEYSNNTSEDIVDEQWIGGRFRKQKYALASAVNTTGWTNELWGRSF